LIQVALLAGVFQLAMRLLHLHFLVRCSYYSLTRPSSNGTPEHPLLLHIIDVDGEHATFSSTTTNRCWLPQVNFLSRSVISGFTSAVSVVFIVAQVHDNVHCN